MLRTTAWQTPIRRAALWAGSTTPTGADSGRKQPQLQLAPTAVEYDPAAVSVYMHWPYCSRICPYCAFNRTLMDKSVDVARMQRAMVTELGAQLAHIGPGRKISSVYFGGGTPSLAPPGLVKDLLHTLRAYQPDLPSGMEVTLEFNPIQCHGSGGLELLQSFAAAGVTRASLGVQTFNPVHLKTLGRDHTPEQALDALQNARAVFPGRVSLDLMFATPTQTIRDWEEDLQLAVAHADAHISLYHLTLEKGTSFFTRHSRGALALPNDDQAGDMLELASRTLSSHQPRPWHRYEVANFAQPSHESQHNLGYWAGNDYLAIGPGAHGRVTLPPLPAAGTNATSTWRRFATVQQRSTPHWLQSVETRGRGTHREEQQTPVDRLQEVLTMALRTRRGITTRAWDAHCSQLSSHLSAPIPTLAALVCDESEKSLQHSTTQFLRAALDNGAIELDLDGLRVVQLHLLDEIMSWLLLRLEQLLSSGRR
ncbi:radical S-adenosyl methionine domain-containing protein 1 [Capsaspora owczarzaki ATCC 30864]|uniref:Radical S-adenosyl methionine domain-containing protein 1, mitochondrial n=1 Tax=Capsaspora owczarzaki (strain ATCC 30864) TaxID=595528 RepID=A0A0D2VUP7_CAPO3|nr:radical S-adenosyl methionine domain-containing protein 1 [Capsaspora owczarzaki ATCC 30864]KJE95092.1 radical S-adenosyl methionine domain-containing protein 1 [Capsaspora owczarzaki ATCC 30864]|eukprot:XP_004346257.1 radical S-adenosyl methionine domain-containing protein 1 [Capsaspora owczarzaki ATCC 30864]